MPRPRKGEEGEVKWIKLKLEGEKKDIFMAVFEASGFSSMTEFIWHLIKSEYDKLPEEKKRRVLRSSE